VDQRNLAMVKLLIEKGANVATTDSNGVTLLHIIAKTDQVAIANLLISRGADINAKDKIFGITPLDYAQGGDKGMIETLEGHGGACTIC